MNIDKEKLLKNFGDIKNIANINILKCKNELFSKQGLELNIGFYLMSLILLLCFILKLIFYNKRYTIKNNINDIEFALNHFFGSKSKEKRNK